MSALTGDRNTPRRDGVQFEYPVAEGVVIYAGALVAMAGGYAYPGAAPGEPVTGVVVGVAEARADNRNGAAGDIKVKVRRGVYRFANGDDEIDLTHVGSNAYVTGDEESADDQTVWAGTGASSLRQYVLGGGIAGSLNVPGIAEGDVLISVIMLDRDSTAANITLADLTDEFSITGADTISNAGGSSTLGNVLLVTWQPQSGVRAGAIVDVDDQGVWVDVGTFA